MGVWARNSKFSGFHCRVSEKKIGEINLFHLENIYLCCLAFLKNAMPVPTGDGKIVCECYEVISLQKVSSNGCAWKKCWSGYTITYVKGWRKIKKPSCWRDLSNKKIEDLFWNYFLMNFRWNWVSSGEASSGNSLVQSLLGGKISTQLTAAWDLSHQRVIDWWGGGGNSVESVNIGDVSMLGWNLMT